ncbi:RNA-binding protein 33 [Leptopilina heterotoma]|uniref:RNA-binding protein 33 n=1 Tax=Leptopilina heterotoma TaxID=63436 RepID=UPI001CA98158|nr:RNA-binding protein 33 [Leptopilina heterotoma]
MRFLKLTFQTFQTILVVVASVLLLTEAKDETKNRDKRQQVSFHSRRGARPPPYAVQMEPIVQYSQRDPLYNSLAIAKSDEDFYDNLPQSYYPSEPEPIIEIIIKESNETLPTPVPPPQPPAPRPTKEPIQVFYVKYEKKKNHSDGKSQVVYDAPIPALTPVEEHEKIQDPHQEIQVHTATPSPPEQPSTTLRAIIRPDSESYHAPGSSGLRVTFGTDQVPPNNHHKRSDQDPAHQVPPNPLPPPGSSKKSHGPYQPLQPVPHRVQPAFPQQRIVNSIPPQQLLQHQQNQHLGPNQQLSTNAQLSSQQLAQNFAPQQFQAPLQNRNSQRPQRLPINIQGLPDFQQKLPFNAAIPHRINPQSSFSGVSPSHQNHQQPQSLNHNFNPEHQQNYKQQEEQKQKYYEQRRHQELLKQREQQRLAEQQRLVDQQRILEQQRHQEQQKFLEHQRLQDQQRRKQEQDQKLLQEHHQYRQQIKYNQGQQFQQNPQVQLSQTTSGEILKAVPKLEQHFAIRENPLHPGPFPPNPQVQDYQDRPTHLVQNQDRPTHLVQSQDRQSHLVQNQDRQTHLVQNQDTQTQKQNSENSRNQQNNNFQQQQQSQSHKSQQQYYVPTTQTQKRVPSTPSIWGRPNSQVNSNHKIYATPASQTEESSVKSQHFTPPVVTTTTTTTTTTTVSPKNEAKIKENIANLPDEVPDDIREQLLSSGILGNADIQILDYDKIGGIPIENLPPEALENFYSAGGAAATSASEPIPAIAKRPKTVEEPVSKLITTEIEQATLKPGGVEMKVVRFDPNTAQGQTIAGQHIREDATHLNPVIVGTKDDPQYNRYLPLKVSGASFPIPDVPELKGKKISSVVVLAPVDYNFKDGSDDANLRKSKKINDVQAIKFLAGESLKQLVKKPSSENYKKWLEQEQKTPPQRQSVVLLVTTPKDIFSGQKEIFMYDVSSQTVSKLSGDLSTAFVDAAESNSDSPDSTDDSYSVY